MTGWGSSREQSAWEIRLLGVCGIRGHTSLYTMYAVSERHTPFRIKCENRMRTDMYRCGIGPQSRGAKMSVLRRSRTYSRAFAWIVSLEFDV